MNRFLLLFIFLFLLPLQTWSGVFVTKPEGMDEPPAQIAASPTRIELKIGKRPANASVKLFNLGHKPVTVSTSVQHWDLDNNNKIRVIAPTPQSLDQWMIINPVQFTIPGGKSQTVRLSIRPPVEPDQGEHRGIIFFNQVVPDDEPRSGIQLTFRLGIVVYGLAGKIVRTGELGAISFHSQQGTGSIQIGVHSTGNAGVRLDGQYSIWRRSEFPGSDKVPVYRLDDKKEIRKTVLQVGRLTLLPVLPGTRRTLSTPVRLPSEAGDYILFVQGKLGDTAFKRQFSFSVDRQ